MGLTVAKNQMIRYFNFDHETVVSDEKTHYCRAMNAVVLCDTFYCKNCPVCVNPADIPVSEDESHVICRYYDLAAGYSHEMTPEELKQRTEGLIAAGLTDEFPEYLEVERRDDPKEVTERAIRFAAKAHKGTFRKGSGLPYIAHPMEVMEITSGMTKDADVIAASALHDVVEDTPISLEELESTFGTRIANLVHLESENKREDMPKDASWKIRKQENLNREKNAPTEAKMIMLADKISNMRATVRDYRKNGRAVWQKFNMKDEKEQEWYYRSVAEVLSELSDLPQYREYIKMLDEVFGEKH